MIGCSPGIVAGVERRNYIPSSKNLAWRLERLEADILPAEEKVIVLQIQGVTADRQVVSSFELKVYIPQGRCGRRGGPRT
jgi:hypothetical protein